MDQIYELLELLNTLILSIVDNMVTSDKANLTNVLTCLQDSQDEIKIFQLELQLQQDEIQQKNQHFELVLVQNPLFEDDENDDVDLDQQPAQEKLNELTPNSSTNDVQLSLSKWIIRLWEEIRNNKHITVIRYEKEVTFLLTDLNFPNNSKGLPPVRSPNQTFQCLEQGTHPDSGPTPIAGLVIPVVARLTNEGE